MKDLPLYLVHGRLTDSRLSNRT